MNIHPCHFRFPISLHHAQELPSVPLIKRRMIRNQIQGLYPSLFHIHTHIFQQRAGNPPASSIFFCIYGAHIGRKIFPIMKIIFNHSQTTYDPIPLHCHIPLRNCIFSFQAFIHALFVCLRRNVPFFMESLRRPAFYLRAVCQTYNFIIHFTVPLFHITKK